MSHPRIILLVLFHDSYRDGDSLFKRCSRDPNTTQAPMPLSLTQDHAAGEAQMAFLKATEPKSLGICEKPEWIWEDSLPSSSTADRIYLSSPPSSLCFESVSVCYSGKCPFTIISAYVHTAYWSLSGDHRDWDSGSNAINESDRNYLPVHDEEAGLLN